MDKPLNIKAKFLMRRTDVDPDGRAQYLWEIRTAGGDFICKYGAMVDRFWAGEPMANIATDFRR